MLRRVWTWLLSVVHRIWEQAKEVWKRKWFRIIGGIVLVLLLVFSLAVIMFGWGWTGFSGGYTTVTWHTSIHGVPSDIQQPPAKTLWDVLQLLFFPAVVSLAGLWFTRVQQQRDQRLADQRAKDEHEAAELRAKTERDIAEDNQHEVALQAYIDKMSELLLHENLRKSEPGEEVRKIARVRTLRVLPPLDDERKRNVIQFLHESRLINKDDPIIDLHEADLRKASLDVAELDGANLSGAKLNFANLVSVHLRRADLRGAILVSAKLNGANLHSADLREANLSEADLVSADLFEADLRGAHLNSATLISAVLIKADLRGTELKGVNLQRANLQGVTGITREDLERQTNLLQGATMPDGTKHT